MILFFFVPMLVIAMFDTGNDLGSDEDPADCAGLHDGPSDGMLA